jgi:hypothetical protein
VLDTVPGGAQGAGAEQMHKMNLDLPLQHKRPAQKRVHGGFHRKASRGGLIYKMHQPFIL